MQRTKRTRQETISLFERFAETFERNAARADNPTQKIIWQAKAEAYELAAFELKHNME